VVLVTEGSIEKIGGVVLDDSDVVLRVRLIARGSSRDGSSDDVWLPLTDPERGFGLVDVDRSGMVCRCGFE
jgi:hypothetical protein